MELNCLLAIFNRDFMFRPYGEFGSRYVAVWIWLSIPTVVIIPARHFSLLNCLLQVQIVMRVPVKY